MTTTSQTEAATDPWAARRLLERYLAETERAPHLYLGVHPEDYPAGQAILAAEPAARIVVLQAALATLARGRTEAARRIVALPGASTGLAWLGEVGAQARAAADQDAQADSAPPAEDKAEQGARAGADPPTEDTPAEPWAPLAVTFPERWHDCWRLGGLLSALARRRLPYSAAEMVRILDALAALDTWDGLPARGIVGSVERRVAEIGLAPEVRAAAGRARATAARHRLAHAETRQVAARLDTLLAADQPATVEIDPHDEWGVAAREALAAIAPADRPAWDALLLHAATATAAKPSGVWQREARRRIHALGEERFIALATTWLALLKAPPRGATRRQPGSMIPVPSSLFTDGNATLLKGLVWCCAQVDDEALAAAVAEAAEGAFKKIPMIGARSTRVGNACLYTLGAMPGPHGAHYLVRLQRQLKQPSARGRLDATLDSAAAQAGVSRDDLEDQAVPTHGLEDGTVRLPVGPYTAAIVVRGARQVDVEWHGPDDAPLAAEPADARRAHAVAYRQAMRVADAVRQTLLAQRDRLERALLAERVWRLADWRRLYLDHPLLAVLARRLVWAFTDGAGTAPGAWHDGRLVDVQDRPLDGLTDATEVRLWHPIAAPAATVLAWREWLARHAVTQPFKQAHREVYLLTDAERAAGTASRRFAAHLLRQHQFQALCRERGWRYGLQGPFDNAAAAIPTLDLPRWGLRAELAVAPVEDVAMQSAHGIFLYVHTESVRFLRVAAAPPGVPRQSPAARRRAVVRALLSGDRAALVAERAAVRRASLAAPVALADVPPVVFSEVMRDVDLFVGVCSVGADPAWLDHAPPRYADYWSSFAFGDLSGSAAAATRRAALETLLPQLAIGPRCTLEDRFLVVRGDLRTYKIHLGSAHVLMAPNDQYLCILPTRGPALPGEPDHLYLPFEGDAVLSLILSKAFLLAADAAIKDPSIRRQIQPA
ncbi:MAG TPA: DUF4132 domain-containing protein [Chloroflexota bacterium]|nr:DUF4132 domain-containing protein [Chloroflexota bacterium]